MLDFDVGEGEAGGGGGAPGPARGLGATEARILDFDQPEAAGLLDFDQPAGRPLRGSALQTGSTAEFIKNFLADVAGVVIPGASWGFLRPTDLPGGETIEAYRTPEEEKGLFRKGAELGGELLAGFPLAGPLGKVTGAAASRVFPGLARAAFPAAEAAGRIGVEATARQAATGLLAAAGKGAGGAALTEAAAAITPEAIGAARRLRLAQEVLLGTGVGVGQTVGDAVRGEATLQDALLKIGGGAALGSLFGVLQARGIGATMAAARAAADRVGLELTIQEQEVLRRRLLDPTAHLITPEAPFAPRVAEGVAEGLGPMREGAEELVRRGGYLGETVPPTPGGALETLAEAFPAQRGRASTGPTAPPSGPSRPLPSPLPEPLGAAGSPTTGTPVEFIDEAGELLIAQRDIGPSTRAAALVPIEAMLGRRLTQAEAVQAIENPGAFLRAQNIHAMPPPAAAAPAYYERLNVAQPGLSERTLTNLAEQGLGGGGAEIAGAARRAVELLRAPGAFRSNAEVLQQALKEAGWQRFNKGAQAEVWYNPRVPGSVFKWTAPGAAGEVHFDPALEFEIITKAHAAGQRVLTPGAFITSESLAAMGIEAPSRLEGFMTRFAGVPVDRANPGPAEFAGLANTVRWATREGYLIGDLHSDNMRLFAPREGGDPKALIVDVGLFKPQARHGLTPAELAGANARIFMGSFTRLLPELGIPTPTRPRLAALERALREPPTGKDIWERQFWRKPRPLGCAAPL